MNKRNEFNNLDKQICFSLYLASKTMIQLYRPILEPLDLTYPQYLVLLVLWENDHIPIKVLGERLYLDSGTLSPLLKKLEAKQLITRTRDIEDERSVLLDLTAKGRSLQRKACLGSDQVQKVTGMDDKALQTLHKTLGLLNQALLEANEAVIKKDL